MERNITEQEKQKIINFGAFGYTSDKMASILMWDKKEVDAFLSDANSEFFRLYRHGDEMCDYVLDLKLFEMAQSGDLKALQKFEFRKTKKNG